MHAIFNYHNGTFSLDTDLIGAIWITAFIARYIGGYRALQKLGKKIRKESK